MFFRTPPILPLLYPRLVWRVPTDQNKIYLTFDDGPVPGPTEFVLDQLNVFKAKATFFCIGSNVEKNQTIFSQILNAGHAVGNHTQNHRKGWATSNDEYIKDIMACQNLMKGTTLFRPPYGRIKRSQARQLGLFKIIMWDVLSYDYSRSVTEARCLKGVVRAVRPGSIVVFHDSYKAEKKMTRVLPLFLDHFAQKGFAFETLSVLE
ncbi:MAG TPA: polysaccharide deacetylase family protein [Cyclobacteriaceae bacterium]|nr:polysaccharide deacetylase family protein [Cyclobacteriaceae bacterium]MCB9238730.1 polysaccharide deacetylase family protein [Flammeovirgaceae bacterium]MCB0498006.1 polysaccharide deacetylase family protein [Cyclobacteriaceae bacterium]MCO5270448.1 polysaccharide deacetylase family protein [Cyclobacteriaceae bacterium]MCW5901110.1 polysaccharide deacetylase family protein [Cyclobacteriaceae bacterium]